MAQDQRFRSSLFMPGTHPPAFRIFVSLFFGLFYSPASPGCEIVATRPAGASLEVFRSGRNATGVVLTRAIDFCECIGSVDTNADNVIVLIQQEANALRR